MLQNLKHLYGRHLAALDGEIGEVKDFIFDDRSWEIRFVVAATADWLAVPQVQIATEAFVVPLIGTARQAGEPARVRLTRAQIAPGSAHQPRLAAAVRPARARADSGSGGDSCRATAGVVQEIASDPPSSTSGPLRDRHLHHALTVQGWRVVATDAPLGTVIGFMAEGHTWSIRQLIVEAGPWYARETVLLRRDQVACIRAADSTVMLNRCVVECRQTPLQPTARTATGVH